MEERKHYKVGIVEGLEEEARKYFTNRTVDEDMYYEWINTRTYYGATDLIKFVKELNDRDSDYRETMVDEGYKYGGRVVERLNALVSTYIDNYIKSHVDEWNTKLDF